MIARPTALRAEPHPSGTTEAIQSPSGPDAVRKRPGMYVGSTGALGIVHLAFELVSNALASGPSAVRVDVDPRGITVSDDGHGLPVDLHPTLFEDAARTLGDPFHPDVHRSGQRLGFGVTAALSSALVVTIDRGRRYEQVFARGEPLGPLIDTGPASGRGTTLYLVPDAGIFGTAHLPLAMLAKRLEELAFLDPRITLSLNGQLQPSYGGIAGYARHLAGRPRRELIASHTHDGVAVQAAIVWGDGEPVTLGFVDQIESEGSHVDAMLAALARTRKRGRVAVVSVTAPDVEFVGRTRREVRDERVRSAVYEAIQLARR